MRLLQVGRLSLCLALVAACTPTPTAAPPPAHPPAALTLHLTRPGFYAIPAQTLQAFGWGLSPTLRLQHQGVAQTWWQADNELRFYASFDPNPYTPTEVYWLDNAPTAPPALLVSESDSDSDVSVSGSNTATVQFEENVLYQPQAATGDRWFWQRLVAGQTQTYPFTLTHLLAGPGQLQLAVWSNTTGPGPIDHHLKIQLNGQVVADAAWDGEGHYPVSTALAEGLLQTGLNQLEVIAVGDTGLAADVVLVDGFSVAYPRALVAEAGQLSWVSAGGAHTVLGLSAAAEVFDVTTPPTLTRIATTSTPAGLVFTGIAGHHYHALDPQAYQHPQLAAAHLTPDWRASTHGADYVAIGPADLLTAAQPLLDWHTAQGRRAVAVPVETLYDQFNFGRAEPHALRAFLQYATAHWQPAPRFVLLLGDTTYDVYGYTVPLTRNRLPSFFVQTHFGGQTVSDVQYTWLDADALPDIALGRVPAETPAQVQAWVQKTLAYAQATAPATRRAQILAVADGQEPQFAAQAQNFLKQFTAPYQTAQLAPPANATAVQTAWNADPLFVIYFGHGSLTQWGKDKLFTVDDVAGLNPSALPVVINMTCLTGLFTHPKVSSLTEALLFKPQGGVVAALAPTSLTLPGNQSLFSNAFAQAFLQAPSTPLGQLVLQAQRQIPTDDANNLEVLQTFWLFGDPALGLVGAE